MRSYETMIIVHPEVVGDAYQEILEKFKGILTGHGTENIVVNDWGMRSLAYPLRKQSRGTYVLLDHSSKPEVITEFERLLRIDESIMKFQTIQVEPKPAVVEEAPVVVTDADAEAEAEAVVAADEE